MHTLDNTKVYTDLPGGIFDQNAFKNMQASIYVNLEKSQVIILKGIKYHPTQKIIFLDISKQYIYIYIYPAVLHEFP